METRDLTDMEKIFQILDSYRDDIISLQADLTSRIALGPANGGTGEHEKAEYLRERLEALGPDYLEEVKAPDKRAKGGYRPNLAAKWKGGKSAPTVWVLSHMDIVRAILTRSRWRGTG